MAAMARAGPDGTTLNVAGQEGAIPALYHAFGALEVLHTASAAAAVHRGDTPSVPAAHMA